MKKIKKNKRNRLIKNKKLKLIKDKIETEGYLVF